MKPVVPPPKPCTLYVAGHTVHWIQALHVANKPEVAARNRTGRLVAVQGVELVIDFGGDAPETFFNHDPDRLLAAAGSLPCEVKVNDEYALMRMRWGYCFSVRPASRGPLDDCLTDKLTDDSPKVLARRLETHGGFSVPASRQRNHVTAADEPTGAASPREVDSPTPATSLVVLVDDVRSFRDARACRVARTAEEALHLLSELRATVIDELWLDYDLGGGTTVMPVVNAMVIAAEAGAPFPVRRVRVHSSNVLGAPNIVTHLRRVGYAVERDYNRKLWTR